MLFNSWQFAVFFPAVVVLYYLAPHRARWALLLVASYLFYMCSAPQYALLLAGSTVVDYAIGLALGRVEPRRTRVALLALSLTANLGLLFTFKYFNFFAGSIEAWGRSLGMNWELPHSDWMLPVGISFYTFQTLSYSIDIFRRRQPAERHFGRYALFVSFFPQLVAGPIERSTNLLPQFENHVRFNYESVTAGLKLMGWGLFKKIVIADQLAVLVNAVYNEPEGLSGVHFALATVFFAFQIYCDFSGYSDIAIGAAQVLGVRLMTNFDRPYAAQSVAEFWSRWHISLSTWFRDYLYIPLGGNRVAVPRWYLNLLVVFVVSGLWHGAAWTFVIWGALHGMYLIVSLATKTLRGRIAARLRLDRLGRLQLALRSSVVFALVCFAWIFFRANSLSDALYIVGQLPAGWEHLLDAGWLRQARIDIGVSERYLAVSAGLILLLNLIESHTGGRDIRELFAAQPWLVRWSAYAGLVLAVINLGAAKAQSFIYFQF